MPSKRQDPLALIFRALAFSAPVNARRLQAQHRAPANSGSAVQDRLFALCVLASIAVHASLLFLFPASRPGEAPPSAARILIARITERASAPQPPVPEIRRHFARDRPRAAPAPGPVAEPPRPVAAESPAAAPQATVATAAAAPETPAAVAPVLSSAASQPAPVSVRAPEAGASAPATRTSDEPDAGSVDRFRRALIDAAARYKRYPVQALERGWQGRVEVHLVIGPTGIIQSSVVKASSGHEILDNQALDMVQRAKPLAPVPATLRGREFSVDIPVIFDLLSG